MPYLLLLTAATFTYPFALQYLRTGEINRCQLGVMLGTVIVTAPRLLPGLSGAVPASLLTGWTVLGGVVLVVWPLRHREQCWRPEYAWRQKPSTRAERQAAAISVAIYISIILLIVIDLAREY